MRSKYTIHVFTRKLTAKSALSRTYLVHMDATNEMTKGVISIQGRKTLNLKSLSHVDRRMGDVKVYTRLTESVYQTAFSA